MKMIVAPEKCTGCKMCADICPREAISFKDNTEGFWYPFIDDKKCIHCHLCEKKCPSIKVVNTNNWPMPKVYAGWTLDNKIRFESTSGGVYYELAKKFITDGGYIAGCVFSDDYKSAKHIVGNDIHALKKIMGSKYFQSDTSGIYRKLRELICHGEKVLFCGTPCQLAAVVAFFDDIPENLYLLDFICKGINSPLAFKAYMEELEIKYHSPIKRVRMKSKKTGWESLATEVQFENGKTYHRDRYSDWWIQGYTCGNLFMRENCQNCQYKQLPRLADISFGDFWGIQGCQSEEYEKGISVILINSKKGEKLLQGIENRMHLEARKMDEILDGNPYFMGQATAHNNRKLFFEKLKYQPFSRAVKSSYTETVGQKGKRWVKIVLKHVFGRKRW